MPETIEDRFFIKLKEHFETLFEKDEQCECGKCLPGRGRAVTFNAFANIYLRDALHEHRQEFQIEIKKINNPYPQIVIESHIFEQVKKQILKTLNL